MVGMKVKLNRSHHSLQTLRRVILTITLSNFRDKFTHGSKKSLSFNNFGFSKSDFNTEILQNSAPCL